MTGIARCRFRAFGLLAALLGLAMVIALATPDAGAAAPHPKPYPSSTVPGPTGHPQPKTIGPARGTAHYAVDQPLCAVPKNPNANRCFAIRRVTVAKGTPGAYRYTTPAAIGPGPAGGFTPDDLAKAYGVNPATNHKQTVGIIDWYNDPEALADLDHFDAHYHLKKETSTSFRKLNQKGRTSPLPKADKNSSGEIALDIESVRGMCHACKIRLIEANSGTDANLATAENLAVRLGANEISNSFGEAEHKVSSSVLAAYNHPGVVITASTGDDGWYAWDRANDENGASENAPEFPSSDPNVVAVGGTALGLNSNGTRAVEEVWNENGADDQVGLEQGHQGAGGGGCSKLYKAKAWQAAYPGYSKAGCKGKRLAADISADADSASGFDVYLTYGGSGWETIGGTSLASPLVAAMYALAGGSHGAAYPSSTLYANGTVRKSSIFDVIAGGNGFCAGDTTTNCGNDVFSLSGGQHVNPNALGAGLLDCSFPHNTSDPASPPPFSRECNAVKGYDGPSGLGTPKGAGVFAQTNPSLTIKHSATRIHRSAKFSVSVKEAVGGTHVVRYTWNWGDGHSTSTTSATTHHTYAKVATRRVSLTETDNRHAVVIKYLSVAVRR